VVQLAVIVVPESEIETDPGVPGAEATSTGNDAALNAPVPDAFIAATRT
jgi:hypothetical protein